MRRWILALVPALAIPVWADTVTLKGGGGKLEGRIVSEDETTVVIRTVLGTRRIPRARVESIRKSRSVYDDWDARLAKTRLDDPGDLARLAQWADSNRLLPEALSIWHKVIEIDPGHAAAKKAIDGFEERPVGSNGRGGGPGSFDRKILVQGRERVYHLFVPAAYAG